METPREVHDYGAARGTPRRDSGMGSDGRERRGLRHGSSRIRAKDFSSKKDTLDYFDKNVEAFKDVLSGQSDEHLFTHWKLKLGDHVAVDMARAACLRSFILSHIIHHRGQLCVYLRENDVPLPALYGPSADEDM